jgi:hypothetical protein
MTGRPNHTAKSDLLDHLRLKLQRRRRYNLIQYLDEDTFNVAALLAQRRIKLDIARIEQQRYFDGARTGYRANSFVKTCKKFLYSNWLNEREFRPMFSMDRMHFWKLHGLIKNNAVFKRGSRGPAQAKSEYQLMVLLAYMRTEGNGMCNEAARNVFFTGSGTIQDMKDRVANAIYADVLEDAVFWPDEEERKVINLSFLEDFGIPNVSAILDGTLFRIAFMPQREDAGDFKGTANIRHSSS